MQYLKDIEIIEIQKKVIYQEHNLNVIYLTLVKIYSQNINDIIALKIIEVIYAMNVQVVGQKNKDNKHVLIVVKFINTFIFLI